LRPRTQTVHGIISAQEYEARKKKKFYTSPQPSVMSCPVIDNFRRNERNGRKFYFLLNGP